MNNYNAIGRIGKDAVTRHTQGGDSVTSWSLAVDSGYGKNKQTLWWDCSLWGKRGESVAEYLTKGAQVGVTGEVGTREHDGKTYLTLRVGDVTLVGGKAEAPKHNERGGGPVRPAPQPAGGTDGFEDQDIPFISDRGAF